MAYQQVGTPRFYIDYISWLSALGWNMYPEGVSVGINPASLNYSNEVTSADEICRYGSPTNLINIPKDIKFDFMAILGHNIASGGAISPSADPHFRSADQNEYEVEFSDIVNFGSASVGHTSPSYDGFTIAEITSHANYQLEDIGYINLANSELANDIAAGNLHIGAFLWGGIYTMSHSPDMSLKLSYDYSGIKTIETKGGASLSNAFYTKPPMWGDTLAAWELSDGTHPNQALSRSGRKIYDLSFSYLDDGDVFGANQSLSQTTMATAIEDGTPPASAFDSDDLADDNTFNDNLLTDDNFFSQVIHKTNGGQLPFIFQPDKNDNTNFIIAKLDMKSFQSEQVANGVYNVKLKIREVW